MRKISLLTIIAFGLNVAAAQQPWGGILQPTRATNWSNAGVIGGIYTVTNSLLKR